MLKRRFSPYNLNKIIGRARVRFFELVILTVLLGMALGLFAAAIYDLPWLFFPKNGISVIVVMVISLVATVIIVGLWLRVSGLNRFDTAPVRIEVAIPYIKTGADRVEIVKQHKERPQYQPALVAHALFHSTMPPGGDENRNLAFAWDTELANNRPVQSVLRTWQNWLVEALILVAVHKYAEDSLSGKARYKWWQVHLPFQENHFADLPVMVQENPFIKEYKTPGHGKGKTISHEQRQHLWKLLLPRDVKLLVEDVSEEVRVYRLSDMRKKSDVIIRVYHYPWVADYRSQTGKVLGEGAPKDRRKRKGMYYVLGSRIEVQAHFEYLIPAEEDPLQQWAAGLISYLEEALDFQYFLRTRPHRFLPDIAWKIGSMEESDSLAQKLDALHRQINGLEKKIEGTQRQIAGLKSDIQALQGPKDDSA